MVLENKLHLTDSVELARVEEKISKKKAIELFENHLLDQYEVGSYKMLSAIHAYLFEDIYDFAGKIRTVNMTKGHFRFASVMYLEEALKNIEKMPNQPLMKLLKNILR